MRRVVLMLALFEAILCGCGSGETDAVPKRLNVVAGTSLIAEAVRHVGGRYVDVDTIIPPGGCPGHFDLKPGDVQRLIRADCVIVHGWEAALLLDLGGSYKGKVHRVEVEGNWMVPEVFVRGLSKVAEVLSSIDKVHGPDYLEIARKAASSTIVLGRELQNAFRPETGERATPVLCDKMQRPSAEWLGLEVVADFGRPEELTPGLLRSLANLGRERGVRLVINNLQSGPKAGRPIAEDLGVPSVVLSNFPGGFPGVNTYEQTLRENIRRVVEALKPI